MSKNDSIFKGTGVPIVILAIIWGVHFLSMSFPNLLIVDNGVHPRTLSGLVGILFSPFIHSTESYSHIINNSVPLFVLSWLFLVSYEKLFLRTVIFIWLFSGLLVWIVGAEGTNHIGASGIIYGLAFFLFFSGAFSKSTRLMSISLIVVFLYGSLVWGLFPTEARISWEGHLFGAIAGTIMAFYFKKEYIVEEKYNLTVNPDFEEFVDEYNEEYLKEVEEMERLKQLENSNNTLNENFKVFFDYIKKKED